MSSPITIVGKRGTSMRVSLIQRHERWWWFITPNKEPDPFCLRGDGPDEEAALGVALYEARKNMESSS